MIVNIRGANGSGKTTIAKKFIKEGNGKMVQLVEFRTAANRISWVNGYLTDEDILVVGKYETACGGCDGIKTQQLAKDAILKASTLAKHVIFEGIIISTIYQGWADFAKGPMADQEYVWAYLNTPLDQCLANIRKRQLDRRVGNKKGELKQIDTGLVADKVRSIGRTRDKARKDGFNVLDIPFGVDPYNAIRARMGLPYE